MSTPIERMRAQTEEQHANIKRRDERSRQSAYALLRVSPRKWAVIHRVMLAGPSDVGYAEYEYLTKPLSHEDATRRLLTLRHGEEQTDPATWDTVQL